jgi:hypothetical protein
MSSKRALTAFGSAAVAAADGPSDTATNAAQLVELGLRDAGEAMRRTVVTCPGGPGDDLGHAVVRQVGSVTSPVILITPFKVPSVCEQPSGSRSRNTVPDTVSVPLPSASA